jgi:hypothetical protein
MSKIKFNLFRKAHSAVLILALILNGCSSNIFATERPPVVDKSFLASEICDPPCWYGLVINKSTKDDVLSVLDGLPFVDNNSYKEYETFWIDDTLANEIQFKCLYNNINPCGSVTFSNKTLKKIWLTVNYDLSLANVINRLGIPDYLIYFWPNPSGHCDISVLWLKKGISVGFQDDKKYNECESVIDGNGVSSEVLVETTIYASQEFFESSFDLPGGCCKRIAWPGFKDK